MKILIVLFFALFLPLFQVFGQSIDLASIEVKDKKARILDDRILRKILDKNWAEYKRTYVIRGEERDYNYRSENRMVRINSDSTYWDSDNSGHWYVAKEKILVISLYDDVLADSMEMLPSIHSAYIIYKVNSNELILAKALSPDFNNRIVYYFERGNLGNLKDQDLMVQSVSKNSGQYLGYLNEKLNMEDLELKDKLELVKLLKTEFFQRGIPEPKDFDKFDKKKLIEIMLSFYNN